MALDEKWFEYEAQVLVPFISNGPLIFWRYPLFGIRGATWFLGVYEGSGSPRDINLFAETGRDASNQGAPSGDGSGDAMRPTRALHDLGQSLWLDNITRELLGHAATLRRTAVGNGAHVESDDLHSCDQEQRESPMKREARRTVFDWANGGLAAERRPPGGRRVP